MPLTTIPPRVAAVAEPFDLPLCISLSELACLLLYERQRCEVNLTPHRSGGVSANTLPVHRESVEPTLSSLYHHKDKELRCSSDLDLL